MSQEVKKMKQGMSYSCKEKTIILNVFKYFRIEFPDKCVTEIVRRTSKATGCSEKSIFQFRKEEASVEGFKEPSKTKIRKNININSRDVKYDATIRQAIRNIIYDLKYKNVVTSLSTILKQVNADGQLPNFSLMTLRRLLFDMGFYYEKNGNKSILVERTGAINKDNIPQKKCSKSKKVQNKTATNTNQSVAESQVHSNPYKIPAANLHKLDTNNQNMASNCLPPNHYSTQSHFIVPMHLGHNDTHMMGPLHPSHNRPMMINTRMPPPPHMVQTPWVHHQNQPTLTISTN